MFWLRIPPPPIATGGAALVSPPSASDGSHHPHRRSPLRHLGHLRASRFAGTHDNATDRRDCTSCTICADRMSVGARRHTMGARIADAGADRHANPGTRRASRRGGHEPQARHPACGDPHVDSAGRGVHSAAEGDEQHDPRQAVLCDPAAISGSRVPAIPSPPAPAATVAVPAAGGPRGALHRGCPGSWRTTPGCSATCSPRVTSRRGIVTNGSIGSCWRLPGAARSPRGRTRDASWYRGHR